MFVMRKPVPIHAETMAIALGVDMTNCVRKTDYILFPYIYPDMKHLVEKCREMRVKTIGYWLGSDSWRAYKEPRIREMYPKFDIEICVHERLQKELKSWGRQSVVVPSVVRKVPPFIEHPVSKLVGVYMPTTDGVYQFDRMCKIAQECPELEFVMYGTPALKALPKNVTNMGKLTPEEASRLLTKFSVLIRTCDHDGFPQNLIETKMLGKHVITNYPYDGCMYAQTDDEILKYLKLPATHRPDPSTAKHYYRKLCSPRAFKEKIESLCQRSK